MPMRLGDLQRRAMILMMIGTVGAAIVGCDGAPDRTTDAGRARARTSSDTSASSEPAFVPATSAPTLRATAYGLGHTPSAATLAALDIDVDPTGHGLPSGEGTAAEGRAVYAKLCASCHGPTGEGVRPAPKIIGRTPAAGHVFATDGAAERTIGNYWPYATTLFDYVRRAMPLNTPGTLSAHDTYAVVAYLLSENGVIAATSAMNARSLPAVTMPARKFFVMDDRTGGAGFR